MGNGLGAVSNSLNINQTKMESLANNLANVNSTGYKRELPFERIISDEGDISISKGLDFAEGELIETNNSLDLALKGDAFFVVDNNGGMEFTRNGKFTLTEDGYIVDNVGNKLMGQNGEIQLEEDFWNKDRLVSINTSGDIYVGDNYIDTLMVVGVENKDDLQKVENNNFRLTNGYFENLDEGEYEVRQGYLEGSNVNPIFEMEEMIRISKDYESAQKMVRSIDSIMEQANEIGEV